MRSGFVESLDLILSDKYEISDREYKALSDILLNEGLGEDIFDTGLIQLMSMMIFNNQKFPISMNYVKEMWEKENIVFDFVSMIGDLVKTGLISLRKVKKDVFDMSDNITKSVNEPFDQSIHIVLYGSPVFNTIYDSFKEILVKPKKVIMANEGVNGKAPKKFIDFVNKTGKLLDGLHMSIELESSDLDVSIGAFRLSLLVKRTSNYLETVLNKAVRKHIKSKYINSVEAYMDSKDTVFLGIDVQSSIDAAGLRAIAEGIYTCFEELEVTE